MISLVKFCFASPSVVNIAAPYSAKDFTHEYYVGLAKMALKLGSHSDDVPQFNETVHMNHARAAVELKKGLLDLIWIGPSMETEAKLRPIRIPLDMGLMGFRRFIILKKNKPIFEKIDSLEQLKKLVACQGTYWTDTKVLRDAGLNVLDTPVHEDLFELLAMGRCDYFPRGLHEGPAEVERWQDTFPEFMVSEKVIIHYPFTIYFFTSKENEQLARTLERGLEKMIDQGLLLNYMKKHPSTSHIFPLRQFRNATFIELTNTELLDDTSVGNSRYWLSVNAFND